MHIVREKRFAHTLGLRLRASRPRPRPRSRPRPRPRLSSDAVRYSEVGRHPRNPTLRSPRRPSSHLPSKPSWRSPSPLSSRSLPRLRRSRQQRLAAPMVAPMASAATATSAPPLPAAPTVVANPVAAAPQPRPPGGIARQLVDLATLRSQGLLDDAEFASAKARVLGLPPPAPPPPPVPPPTVLSAPPTATPPPSSGCREPRTPPRARRRLNHLRWCAALHRDRHGYVW